MNKLIFPSILLFALLIAACTSATNVSSNRPAGAANSNISFGIYDISSSGSAASQPVVNQGDLLDKGGGGGGAKEGRHELNTVSDSAERISMNQATALQNNPSSARKIIRNAELSLETEQPEEAQKRVAAIAESKGGFVVESQQSSSDIRVSNRDIVFMSVRVPSERFVETLAEIRAASGRVISETIKGEDVTEEFIDIEARLKAKRALEQQFMEIMKRANTVDDALSVQTQLADVRGEIEKIEGRMRFLQNQASLSTIKLRIQTAAVFSANSAGFGYRLSDSFGRGLDVALNFILGLVTFVVGVLPFAIVFGIPGFLISRYLWRKQKRPMTVQEIAEEEIKPD